MVLSAPKKWPVLRERRGGLQGITRGLPRVERGIKAVLGEEQTLRLHVRPDSHWWTGSGPKNGAPCCLIGASKHTKLEFSVMKSLVESDQNTLYNEVQSERKEQCSDVRAVKNNKEAKQMAVQEQEKFKYAYEYPRPSVTTDILIFSIRGGVLHVLLIKRGISPYKGRWAIPGGFVRMDEDIEAGALRELKEETGFPRVPLRQLQAYGKPKRDPRDRVITVAFMALVRSDNLTVRGGSDAKEAQWWSVNELPKLAFDHDKIVRDGMAQLSRDVTSSIHETGLVAFDFLPEKFTLSEAQSVFETLRGETMDKRNFRKWFSNEWEIEDTGEKTSGGRHRPAALFRLKRSD